MINVGRNGDNKSQTVTLTASTQEVIRVWSAGVVRLYSEDEIRILRGPDTGIADGSGILPTNHDRIPAGAGERLEVTRKEIARMQRREGSHYVDLSVWDLSGSTVRVGFEPLR